MKILIYSLNYWPEPTGVGKFSGDMGAKMSAFGHDVRVLCSPPYYPSWRVSGKYLQYRYTTELFANVKIFRAPIWVPRRVTGFSRLLHLFSFSISSLPALIFQLLWRPEVIWVVVPTLACTPGALLLTSLCGARSWLHIQDYEVDAAFDLGIVRGDLLRRTVLAIEQWLMRRFDRVSTISERMLDRARKKGISQDRLVLFQNWVDVSNITPLNRPSSYRSELGISDASVVVQYSGNMGSKQGLEILADLAHQMLDDQRVVFVFGGDGSGRAELEKHCAGLGNVHFVDLQPFERLNEWLGLADVHLLPQRSDATDLVMPSKLTGMLASGRPVIATAHEHTELWRVVKSEAACGLVVPPENVSALASALRTLVADQTLRSELGGNGRRYAEQTLDKESILRRFEAQLQDLVVEGRR